MINKNFGKLILNHLEYAPNSFKTELGIILNPPAEFYIQHGYYHIVDVKPEPESGCYVSLNGYEQDDEKKTITFKYVQTLIPIIQETKTYSKLKLEMALFKINKLFEFDRFLDETYLRNEAGMDIAIRRLYDQANDLKTDNEYFETYFKLAKDKIGIDDETAQKILDDCLMDR